FISRIQIMQRPVDATAQNSANRPRVLFVAPGHPYGPDGITDYTFWLAAAAGRVGVDCLVYTLFPFDDSQAGYAARFPSDGPARLIVKSAPSSPLHFSQRVAMLSTICRQFRPDWTSLQFNPVNY